MRFCMPVDHSVEYMCAYMVLGRYIKQRTSGDLFFLRGRSVMVQIFLYMYYIDGHRLRLVVTARIFHIRGRSAAQARAPFAALPG